MLWEEFDTGIGNRKPARFFTAEDRNDKKNQSHYKKRSHFWMAMTMLIERGTSSRAAVSRIYQVYPNMKISEIHLAMQADRKNKVFRFMEAPKVPKSSILNHFGQSKEEDTTTTNTAATKQLTAIDLTDSP